MAIKTETQICNEIEFSRMAHITPHERITDAAYFRRRSNARVFPLFSPARKEGFPFKGKNGNLSSSLKKSGCVFSLRSHLSFEFFSLNSKWESTNVCHIRFSVTKDVYACTLRIRFFFFISLPMYVEKVWNCAENLKNKENSRKNK